MLPLDPAANRRRIYLLRHAEAAYIDDAGRRTTDSRMVPLTTRGRGEASAMGDALAGIAFDRAVVSGLPRTRETAEIVLSGRVAPAVEVMPAFEELHPGRFLEMDPATLYEDFTQGLARAATDPSARFLGGERFDEFAARVVPAFEALAVSPGWKTLLLVAHGGTNLAILGWIANMGLQSFAAFEQDSGCMNIIDLDVVEGRITRKMARVVNHTPVSPVKHDLLLTTMESMLKAFAAAKG